MTGNMLGSVIIRPTFAMVTNFYAGVSKSSRRTLYFHVVDLKIIKYHNLLAIDNNVFFYASYIFVLEGQLPFESSFKLYHEAPSISVRE